MVNWQLGDGSQQIVNTQTHDAFRVFTVQQSDQHMQKIKRNSRSEAYAVFVFF